MVTAEIAAALPVLVVVLVAVVWAVAAATAQLRCADAAREAARSLARGDAETTARALALAVAPAGASVQIRSDQATVHVQVSARAPLPPPFGSHVPAPTVKGSATALVEGGDRAVTVASHRVEVLVVGPGRGGPGRRPMSAVTGGPAP